MNVSDAAHKTMLQHPGGSKTLALRIGMVDGTLRNKCNPNCSTHSLSIEEASEIMGVTGDFRMLHALAAEHGFVCTKVDAGDEVGSVFHMLLSSRAADGTLSSTLQAALSDNKITPNESTRISAAIMVAVRALLDLDAACKAETCRPTAEEEA